MNRKRKKININLKVFKPEEYIAMLTSYTCFLNHPIKKKKIKVKESFLFKEGLWLGL